MPNRRNRNRRPPAERQPCDCAAQAAYISMLQARLEAHADLVAILEHRRRDGRPMANEVIAALERIAIDRVPT